MDMQKATPPHVSEAGTPVGLQGILSIKVYSPLKVYYDGSAESLTAENDTGQFDVLVGHKNFLSLLNPCDIIIRTSTGQESISIARGIIHVHNNKITVFLDV